MFRIPLIVIGVFSSILTAPVQAANCLQDSVLFRSTTIEDASGRWENQDLLIEAGMIVAMGGELSLEDQSIAEIDLSGHVLSPLQVSDVLVIQTSLSLEPQGSISDILLAGEPASFQIARADGVVLAELQDGQPLGQCFAG